MRVKFPNSENEYKMDDINLVITGSDLNYPTEEPVREESEELRVSKEVE